MAVMLLLVLSLVFASPLYAQDDPVQPDSPPVSYQILGAGFFGKRSALQKKLEEASSHGYHVVGGFEGVVLVHKAQNDERRVYTAAANSDIKSLERQMNDAAAIGFRMVPEAALTSPSLAVMAKRIAAPPVGAEYRLFSFKASYEIGDVSRAVAINGGFETDLLDERLAEMAVAGYRLVALATRDLDKCPAKEQVVGGLLGTVLGKRGFLGSVGKALTTADQLCQELIVIFEKESDAPVVTNVRDAARRYHAVAAGTEAELEAQLNRAAAAGYRLLTIAPNAFPVAMAIVEKQPVLAAPPTYRVLVPSDVSSMTDELSHAAATGWLPHARGVLDPSGGRLDMPRVLFVLERQQRATPGTLRVLDAMRSSTLARELNQATADGFELVAGGASHGLKVLVLQAPGLPRPLGRVPAVDRRAGAGRAEEQPAAISEGHVSPVALP